MLDKGVAIVHVVDVHSAIGEDVLVVLGYGHGPDGNRTETQHCHGAGEQEPDDDRVRSVHILCSSDLPGITPSGSRLDCRSSRTAGLLSTAGPRCRPGPWKRPRTAGCLEFSFVMPSSPTNSAPAHHRASSVAVQPRWNLLNFPAGLLLVLPVI